MRLARLLGAPRHVDSRRSWPPASRSSTTSCSTSAARSACSRRSATPGRTPTSSPPSTTRRAPRGASRDRRRRRRSCSALRPTSRTFRPLLPLYPHAIESLDLRGYDIVDLVLERVGARRARRSRRGARLLLPQPVPLRLVRARGDARGPQPARAARRCGVLLNRWRQWDWIAAQRVDRYVANSHAHRRARAPLLRARGDRPAPAGGARALPRPAPVGDALPGARRADGAQAHRRRRARLQRARGCRSSWSATGRSCAGCGGSPGPTVRVHRPASATSGSPSCCARARALVVTAAEEFGIAAVESLASGRPVIALGAGGVLESVREGVTGAFYERGEPGRAGRGGRALRPAGASTRRPASPRAERFGVGALPATGCARSSPRRCATSGAPRAGRAPAVARAAAGVPPGARAAGKRESMQDRVETSAHAGTKSA